MHSAFLQRVGVIVMGDGTEPQPAMAAVSYDDLLLGWEGEKEKQAKDMAWERERGKD